jgi:hypothetical protein
MQNLKLANYIKKSSDDLANRKETLLFTNITVYIKDPLPEHVSLGAVLARIEAVLPKRLITNLDAIYVGEFEHLKKREVNAAFQDGALYISNVQDDEDDLLDDVIHEIAHSVEEEYGLQIYGDGVIEKEFIGKRKQLYNLLRSYDYDVQKSEFLNIDFSEDFDDLLYKGIGYDKLEHFTMGLFPSNYSVTSLREYFAVGFERYFLNSRTELAKVSPELFNTVEQLVLTGEKNEEEVWLDNEQHHPPY